MDRKPITDRYITVKGNTEYCNMCGLDLTRTREMNLAHNCDKSDLAAQCMQYRDMLQQICEGSSDVHWYYNNDTAVIGAAKELLMWEE